MPVSILAFLFPACAPELADSDTAVVDEKRPADFCARHPSHASCTDSTPAAKLWDCGVESIAAPYLAVPYTSIDLVATVRNYGASFDQCDFDITWFLEGSTTNLGGSDSVVLELDAGASHAFGETAWWGVPSGMTWTHLTGTACASARAEYGGADEDSSNDCASLDIAL